MEKIVQISLEEYDRIRKELNDYRDKYERLVSNYKNEVIDSVQKTIEAERKDFMIKSHDDWEKMKSYKKELANANVVRDELTLDNHQLKSKVTVLESKLNRLPKFIKKLFRI